MERAAAGTFVPVATELRRQGTPATSWTNADLDAAVDGLMDGAIFNSRPVLLPGSKRIYVHQSLYDAFVEKGGRLGEGAAARQPAGEGHDAGPHGHVRFARLVREADRRPPSPSGATAPLSPGTPPTTAAPT